MAAANRAAAAAANSAEAANARERALFLGSGAPEAPGAQAPAGGAAAARARRRDAARSAGSRALAALMAVVLAVGLMPLPAFGDDGSLKGVSFNGNLVAASETTTTTVDAEGNVTSETTRTAVDDEGNVETVTVGGEEVAALDAAASARGSSLLGAASGGKGTIADLQGHDATDGGLSTSAIIEAAKAEAEADEATAKEAAEAEARAAFEEEDASLDVSGLDDAAFATQRVVVALDEGAQLQERDLNNVASEGSGLYVLEYKNVEAAKRAYVRYSNYEGTAFAAPDSRVEASAGGDEGNDADDDGDDDADADGDEGEGADAGDGDADADGGADGAGSGGEGGNGAAAVEDTDAAGSADADATEAADEAPVADLGSLEGGQEALEGEADRRESEDATKPAADRDAVVALVDTAVPADFVDRWNEEHGSSAELVGRVSAIGEAQPDEVDEGAHGAKMLETILESDPDARVLSVEALDGTGYGSAATVYAALTLATAARADIYSMSFAGYAVEGNEAIKAGVEEAQLAAGDQERALALLAAAGNMGQDVKWFAPASYDGVQGVGALDPAKAPYDASDLAASRQAQSNYGEGLVWAPAESTSYATAIAAGTLSAMRDAIGTDDMAARLQVALLSEAGERAGETSAADDAATADEARDTGDAVEPGDANQADDAAPGVEGAVAFDPNDSLATGAMDALRVENGTFTAPESAYALEGSYFSGWVTAPDNEGNYVSIPAGADVRGWSFHDASGGDADLRPFLEGGDGIERLTLYATWGRGVLESAADLIDAQIESGTVMSDVFDAVRARGMNEGVFAAASNWIWAGSSTTNVNYSSGTATISGSGGVLQPVTLPAGVYELTATGAGGAASSWCVKFNGEMTYGANTLNQAGAKGGQSKGVYVLTQQTVVYVNVGGHGVSPNASTQGSGGYNGGGLGGQTGTGSLTTGSRAGGGGGATSFTIGYSGTLKDCIADANGTVVLVAGGGAGGAAGNTSTGGDGGTTCENYIQAGTAGKGTGGGAYSAGAGTAGEKSNKTANGLTAVARGGGYGTATGYVASTDTLQGTGSYEYKGQVGSAGQGGAGISKGSHGPASSGGGGGGYYGGGSGDIAMNKYVVGSTTTQVDVCVGGSGGGGAYWNGSLLLDNIAHSTVRSGSNGGGANVGASGGATIKKLGDHVITYHDRAKAATTYQYASESATTAVLGASAGYTDASDSAGRVFVGWTDDRDGTDLKYTYGKSYRFTSSVNLYPVYKYVTYYRDSDGGEIGTHVWLKDGNSILSESDAYAISASMAITDPKVGSGQVFVGWNTEKNPTSQNPGTWYRPGANVSDACFTLYAQYSDGSARDAAAPAAAPAGGGYSAARGDSGASSRGAPRARELGRGARRARCAPGARGGPGAAGGGGRP